MRHRTLVLVLVFFYQTGCDSNEPEHDPNSIVARACTLPSPGWHADPFDGRPVFSAPWEVNGVGANIQLIARQTAGGVERKFVFILPSLAPGEHDLGSVYVSYTERSTSSDPTEAPPVWRASSGKVFVDACAGEPFSSLWVHSEGWTPMPQSPASGTLYPYGWGRTP